MTEYWELDLGKNVNIAEIAYYGGSLQPLRSLGLRIQFLYSKATNETPIMEIQLPTDDAVQLIPLYVSSVQKPKYPYSGKVQIPRPIPTDTYLGDPRCLYNCKDSVIINNLVQQFNSNAANSGSEIVKVMRGITSTPTTCEYEVELLAAVPTTTGSSTKRTITNQSISMNLSPSVIESASPVYGRYVRVIPSFAVDTVLEISHLVVINTDANGMHYNVSAGNPIDCYNQSYLMDQLTTRMGSNAVTGQQCTLSVVNGIRATPASVPAYSPQFSPNVYEANDNDPQTFFQVDLGKTEKLHQIIFVGRSDYERIPGGIVGIQIQVFADRPADQLHATDGTYDPVFTYTLPTDDCIQTFDVLPPPNCTYTLSSTTMLPPPIFLQPNSPAFSSPDTSGGVFTFASVLSSVTSAMNKLLPLQSTDLVTPITANVKQSDSIVQSMLTTVAQAQTLAGTTKKCSDPDVLGNMMTAYNIVSSASSGFGDTTHTMTRIIKAGQSTPNTCDVLFEDLYTIYDDYMVDVTDKTLTGKQILASRFVMNAGVPDLDPKKITDISANALGILSDTAILTPTFSGPACSVNCRDPAIIAQIKSRLEQYKIQTAATTTNSSFTALTKSFQPSPNSCEYEFLKNISIVNKFGSTVPDTYTGISTYAKAMFNLSPAPGCRATMVSATEYDPYYITFSTDPDTGKAALPAYYNGVQATLPFLYNYDPKTATSVRVNAQIQNI
jgi:hypothetical protein